MKITIDTQVDSHNDIMKAIQLLHHFVGSVNSVNSGNSFLQDKPREEVDTTSMMSMFGSPQPMIKGKPEEKEIPDTPPDFSSFLKLTRANQEQPKQNEEHKIEFF